MDWPEISSKMSPVDNKENNAELVTAQTEPQLKKADDEIRLKPVQPVLSVSLPETTELPGEISDKEDCSDDVVVNQVDIGCTINVDDEIMCSVDQFEMKADDLNLLTDQIPSVIEDVLENEDLEKDLSGTVEENRDLRSICEIITPNSTLTSLTLIEDSVGEKLDLLQSDSTDDVLLTDINESIIESDISNQEDAKSEIEIVPTLAPALDGSLMNCDRETEKITAECMCITVGDITNCVIINEQQQEFDKFVDEDQNVNEIYKPVPVCKVISECGKSNESIVCESDKKDDAECIKSKSENYDVTYTEFNIIESGIENENRFDLREGCNNDVKGDNISCEILSVETNTSDESSDKCKEINNSALMSSEVDQVALPEDKHSSDECVISNSKCSLINDQHLQQANFINIVDRNDEEMPGVSYSTVGEKVELCKEFVNTSDEKLEFINIDQNINVITEIEECSTEIEENHRNNILVDSENNASTGFKDGLHKIYENKNPFSEEFLDKMMDSGNRLVVSEMELIESSENDSVCSNKGNWGENCLSVKSIEIFSEDESNAINKKEIVDNGCANLEVSSEVQSGLVLINENIEHTKLNNLSEGYHSSLDKKKEDGEEDCVIVECVKKDGETKELLVQTGSADTSVHCDISSASLLSTSLNENGQLKNDQQAEHLPTKSEAASSFNSTILNNSSCIQYGNASVNVAASCLSNNNTFSLVSNNNKNSNSEPLICSETSSAKNELVISKMIGEKSSLPLLPVNLNNLNNLCVQNEKNILSVPEKFGDVSSVQNKKTVISLTGDNEDLGGLFTEIKTSSSPINSEKSKKISEAVKFFFQKGSSHLNKFLAPTISPSVLQSSTIKVGVRKSSTDSEPCVSSQNKVAVCDAPQRPRSCEAVDSGAIPVSFIPELMVDGCGRKLHPLLPKIPVAFLISSSSEQKSVVAGGMSVSEVGSSAATITTSSSSTATIVASVGVNTNFNADNVVMPPKLQPSPRPLKQKKCNQVKQKQQNLKKNQLSLAFFNTLNAVSPAPGGFLAANLGNGQLSDLSSVEQLFMSANSDKKPQIKPKGQPRKKGVEQRARVSTCTSIDDGLTCTNDSNFGGGGGVCGRRLQNVVNKLHQAISPNTAAADGISSDSILHTLLVSKDKQPDHSKSGPVQPSVQCLKVVESVPSSKNNIITTFRIPSALTIIPQTVVDGQSKSTEISVPKKFELKSPVEDNVVNRLKKLGTIIEVEREPPQCVTPSSLPPPPPLTPICMTRTSAVNHSSCNSTSSSSSSSSCVSGAPEITAQCMKMLNSLAQTNSLVPVVPRKRTQSRKRQNSLSSKLVLNLQNSGPRFVPIKPKDTKGVSSVPKETTQIHDVVNTEVLLGNLSETSSASLKPNISVQTSSSQTFCMSTTTLSVAPVNATCALSTLSDKIVPSNDQNSIGSVLNVSKGHQTPSLDVFVPKQIDPKFVFQIDSSQVINLPSGQRMLTCDICDGVYHKTMSLKRHYLRSHINKKYLSESDQLMCGMIQLDAGKPLPPKKITKVFIGDLSNWINSCMPGLFHCFTCGACFDQKIDLKTHLMEHPPVSLMKVKEGALETFMCSGCSKTFPRKNLFVQHRKICDQKNATPLLNQHCLYCDKSFLSVATRNKHHFKLHHPKRKHQPCFICKTEKCKGVSALFKHMCLQHKDKYFACIPCKIRFLTRTELLAHDDNIHSPRKLEKKVKKSCDDEGNDFDEDVEDQKKQKNVDSGKESTSKHKCSVCSKPFSSELNVSRHYRLAHGIHPRRKIQTQTPVTVKDSIKTESNESKEVTENSDRLEKPLQPPVIMDPETRFYSQIAVNIRENLLHHLDGKLDSQEILEYDLNASADQVSKHKLMNFSASFTSSRGASEVEPTLDGRQTSNPVSPKVPWEKFNFPKNYDGRCGLTSYIKDMSHLDISTQLTMRRNLQRLNSAAEVDPSPDILVDIPAGLSLIGASCAETFGEDASDSSSKEELKETELSGEWTRPRSYVCAVCNLNTSNFWELEDHKMALHPNVWCPHHEVLAEHTSCWELVYTRATLAPSGILGPSSATEVPATTLNNRCTKCNKNCANSSDLHRHMLDCGGDTTWMTMLGVASPGGSRRNRKWRPFGSRRRRQQGRRGLKRNIPNTPAKQPGMRVRTKPGDTESIQKMIANLPPKRITRRIIGEDGEIKTRSQGTISSASVGISVMQKSRSSLTKYVKKSDSFRSAPKHLGATSVKTGKEIKNIEETKDNVKLLRKPIKPVKKLFTEDQVEVKQEISSDIKLENVENNVKTEVTLKNDKENCHAETDKNETTNCEVGEKLAAPGAPVIEIENIENEKKYVKTEGEPKAEYKEINIIVVSSGKRTEPNSSIEMKLKNEEIVQVKKKKKVGESKKESKNYFEEFEWQKKMLKTPSALKIIDDKGAVEQSTTMDPLNESLTLSELRLQYEAELKLEISQKKPVKRKKEENDKPKSSELNEKKKKETDELQNSQEKLIICNGCGAQFDSVSVSQRHMKKCVYWKEEKILDENVTISKHTCVTCRQTFPFHLALVNHKCDSSSSEDRTMPELKREEPFEVTPVEMSKDIPVLSPEEIQRNTIGKAAVGVGNEKLVDSVSPSKQPTEKKKVNKTVYKRTSSIESIADTIREVSLESFSIIDKFTWVNGAISHKKDFPTIASKSVQAPDVALLSTVSENVDSSVETSVQKSTKDIVMFNSTIKTVPKLVKISTPIVQRKSVKEVDKKPENLHVRLTKVHHATRRKVTSVRQRRKIKNIRKNMIRPSIKKKRSTALEILLRENKLMAESRKPVKTVEKRRHNSPSRGIRKSFGKRRKFDNDEVDSESFCSTVDSKEEVETKESIVNDIKMEVVSENEEEGKNVENKNNDDITDITQSENVKPNHDIPVENYFNEKQTNYEEDSTENSYETDEKYGQRNLEKDDNKSVEPTKNSPRSPKKLKLQNNDSLIIVGSRRKTNAINRWDMYRPSCSNGRVYCEPCNKEVKEDGMSKHEVSTFHLKNVDLKNDFDNLFPDPYKFVTSCSQCSWNFATPFTCYKHYLLKHEDSLLEILEQAMVQKKDFRSVLQDSPKKTKMDEIKSCQEKFEIVTSETFLGSIKGDTTKQEPGISNLNSEKLKFITEENETYSPEMTGCQSGEGEPNIMRSKPVSSGSKMVYCDVCNKGIKLDIMIKHEQSYIHKKNINLKKVFNVKFLKDKQKLFPVYCEKCNWHFTSPFLCYKHYLWKHPSEVKQLFGPLESASDGGEDVQIVDKYDSSSKGEVPANLGSSCAINTESDKCERLAPVIPDGEVDTSVTLPSHLNCRICCKKVKYDLVFRHVNTSLHKQNVKCFAESVTLPTECNWCQWVEDSPFLCDNHFGNKCCSISLGAVKKKRKKKKSFQKLEEESENSNSNERLINFVRQGRIIKRRKKKLKLRRMRDKLSGSIEKTAEIRTDVSSNISSDRLLKRKKKRYKMSHIRNSWKVSVVDPGLATASDSSCHDVKVEIKTEKPEMIQTYVPDISKATPSTSKVISSTVCTKTMAAPTVAATDKRSSSVGGSEFYCLLCQKQFSSSVLLVKHQNSLMHKLNESRNIQNLQIPRSAMSRATVESSFVSAQCKRGVPPVTNIKLEPSSTNAIKSKEPIAPSSTTASSLPHIMPQIPGSEGSETSQEWVDNSKYVNLDQPDNILEQSATVQSQDWTHNWVMNSANCGGPQWDVNTSASSQLWDNSDNTFMNSVGCSSSLGSILDSVNKILANDGDASLLPQYSLAELQSAMGASDEEMAMLQQLGERSLQEEFMYESSGSLCSHHEQWSGSASVPSSNLDENTTTLMDLDNQQPTPPPPPPSSSPSSLASVQQDTLLPNAGATTTTTSSTPSVVSATNNSSGCSTAVATTMKAEPVDCSDNTDKNSCRGLMGRPRRLLSDYESREMVCPSCSKHFLGLSALQSHLAWSKCSQHTNSGNTRSNMWLKRRAMLNRPEDVDRRLVCFICKEIFNCPSALNKHVSTNHMKKEAQASLSPNQNSESSDGAKKLKSKMSSALGGLLDRAMNNLLGSKGQGVGLTGQEGGPELSSGAIQFLGKLCATRFRNESSATALQATSQCRQENSSKEKLCSSALSSELRQIMSRGGKSKTENLTGSNNAASPKTTLNHLAMVLNNGQDQRPYACPVCDDRFMIPSTRSRHMARCHGKFGHSTQNQIDEENETVEPDNPDTKADSKLERDWRDMASPAYDSDEGGGTEEDAKMKPLCSDCGLSFASVQDVVNHRKEFHSSPVKEEVDLPVSENIVDSTSGEGKRSGKIMTRSSGNRRASERVESTELVTRSRRRLRSTASRRFKEYFSESNQQIEDEVDKESSLDSNSKIEGKIKEEEDQIDDADKNPIKKKLLNKPKRRKSHDAGDDEEGSLKNKRDKKKDRLPHLVDEDVRVKAEAALRELNFPKINRMQSSTRWGIDTLRFTKHNSTDIVRNTTAALAKAKFAALFDSKWKIPNSCNTHNDSSSNAEPISQSSSETEKHSDVYDFNDEDLCSKKMSFSFGQRNEKDRQQDNTEKGSNCKQDVDLLIDS